MQLIRDIYAAKKATGKPVVSLEFFPPKTEEGDKALLEKLHLDSNTHLDEVPNSIQQLTLTLEEYLKVIGIP